MKSITLKIFNIALKLKERMKLCQFVLHFGGRRGALFKRMAATDGSP